MIADIEHPITSIIPIFILPSLLFLVTAFYTLTGCAKCKKKNKLDAAVAPLERDPNINYVDPFDPTYDTMHNVPSEILNRPSPAALAQQQQDHVPPPVSPNLAERVPTGFHPPGTAGAGVPTAQGFTHPGVPVQQGQRPAQGFSQPGFPIQGQAPAPVFQQRPATGYSPMPDQLSIPKPVPLGVGHQGSAPPAHQQQARPMQVQSPTPRAKPTKPQFREIADPMYDTMAGLDDQIFEKKK